MTPEESDRLRELCTQAQNEMDPVRLVQLIQEINRVFEQSEERERTSSRPEDPEPETS
jgi:hypothetical protein